MKKIVENTKSGRSQNGSPSIQLANLLTIPQTQTPLQETFRIFGVEILRIVHIIMYRDIEEAICKSYRVCSETVSVCSNAIRKTRNIFFQFCPAFIVKAPRKHSSPNPLDANQYV